MERYLDGQLFRWLTFVCLCLEPNTAWAIPKELEL
jgi:hypothetical protein